jgi:hypothetical protein
MDNKVPSSATPMTAGDAPEKVVQSHVQPMPCPQFVNLIPLDEKERNGILLSFHSGVVVLAEEEAALSIESLGMTLQRKQIKGES